MKNIKRIICLGLAAIMLTVGSHAAFNDEDKIVNKEAATITAGLGLFAGTADGDFDPSGNVTRAQMSAVITKMIYGSDINADSFKGTGKFSDTDGFESGWAEGYINICSNLGVIAGYGDGTFKPGAAVTTAEATTMLINALDIDAGEGQWPMTVMAAAETAKLFEDLVPKPATNAALTRDQLAVMVLNALYYSPEGGNVYVVNGNKYDSFTDAYLAAGLNPNNVSVMPAQDTLATETFGMISEIGYITANQATGEDYTEINHGELMLNLETGLDMIGHYVTVYYAEEYESEDEPGVAYAIVDEADYVIVDEDIDSKKEYREYFGNKKYSQTTGVVVNGSYEVEFNESFANHYDYEEDSIYVTEGTYMIHEGVLLGYFAEPEVVVGKIGRVNKDAIYVNGHKYENNDDTDEIVEYKGITKDDIVVVVNAQGILYVEKANCVIGEISRISEDEDGKTVITVGGKKYTQYQGETLSELDNINFNNSNIFNKNFEIYIYGNEFLGLKTVGSTADVSDIVYVVDTYDIYTMDDYGKDVVKTYAQGIDVKGNEVSYLIDINTIDYEPEEKIFAGNFYTFDEANDKDAKKHDIMAGTSVGDEDLYVKTSGYQDLDRDDYVMRVNGKVCFITEDTRFIVYNGTEANLEVATSIGSINKEFDSADVVLSEMSNGNIFVEIVVINGDVDVSGEDLVYIYNTNGATTADGVEMEVYFTENGVVKTILVDENYGEGFYTYTYDAVEEIYELSKDNGHNSYVLTSVYNDNIVFNGEGLYAGAAKIFDARDEETIEESDISRIETLEDMSAANSAEYKITFFAIVDDDDSVNIIITDIAEVE